MLFAIDIPELEGPSAFPAIFTHVLMGPQCQSYAGQAMLTSFVRFVEAARLQYRVGQSETQKFVRSSTDLYGFIHASAAFETCIGYMHRAMRCMEAIRSRTELADVKNSLFPNRPDFMSGKNRDRIRQIRDAIQHSDTNVFNGRIAEGTPFLFRLDGDEVPVLDEPGQTIKTWNRVNIGDQRISCREIAELLNEMAVAAVAVVTYRPATSELRS